MEDSLAEDEKTTAPLYALQNEIDELSEQARRMTAWPLCCADCWMFLTGKGCKNCGAYAGVTSLAVSAHHGAWGDRCVRESACFVHSQRM